MEQESLEQKQKYLREHVLEKGYDPDQFMEFLTGKKGEQGINLENWSLKDLMEVTEEFLSNNKMEIESNLNFGNKDDGDNENENENTKEKEKEKEKQNNSESPKEKKEYININSDNNYDCYIIEQTPITSKKTIDIEVTKPKIEKGGFFSSSYSTYLIVTSTLNVQVRRKYTDFIWLNDILKSQFVNCIVPPFFKRKEKLDKNILDKRIFYIEQFLNDIATHPILRNSKIFYDFISIQDDKKFHEAKKSYNKLKSPTSIKQFKTQNGELNKTFNEDIEDYYKIINSKLNNQEIIYDKLFYHYKLLLINLNQSSLQMKEISKIWIELYNQKDKLFGSKGTAGVYESYSKIMDNWIDLNNNQYNLIVNSIRKFYKYIKEEYNCFKDLAILVENHKNIYDKKNQKILSAKENFFSKFSKSEKAMKEQEKQNENNKNENIEEIEFNKFMHKDIIKFNQIKDDYGCYLNIYVNEYERLRDINDIKFKKNLLGFINEFNSQISNYSFRLSEIVSFIDTLY